MTGKLKKVSQRFFALLVASLIVFAGFPFSAIASEVNSNTEEAFENIEYTKNDTKPSSTGTSSNITYTYYEAHKMLAISGTGDM